jgi:hypothetical protein
VEFIPTDRFGVNAIDLLLTELLAVMSNKEVIF